jgi:hypothetical protein
MDVDWIDRAQDRDRWRTVGNSVLKFRVPFGAEQEGLSSMELEVGGVILRTSFSICIIFPKVMIISTAFSFPVLYVCGVQP